MGARAREWVRKNGLCFAVWGIALTASFLNLLNFNDYPLLSPEVGLVFAGLGLVTLAMGGLHLLSRPRISFLFVGLFTAAIVDINATIETAHIYAIWGAVSALAYFRETIALKLIGAAFASVALFQAAALVNGGGGLPPRAKAQTALPEAGTEARPPIVHIVLDSYLGLEGMRYDGDRFGDLLAAQKAFYSRHGFQAYDGAYSRHVKTLNSLPYAFSYGRAPLATTSQNKQYVVPARLDYFGDLEERGYIAGGLMPDFVDLCVNQAFSRCELFMRSGLDSMVDSGMSPASKAATFAYTMLTLSSITVKTGELLQIQASDLFGIESRRIYNQTKLFPLASSRALSQFTQSLSTIRRGELRYGHLLLPHDPYVFGSDCSLKPRSEWLDEHGPGTLVARDEAYADQVVCTLNRLDELMAVLNSTAAGRDAIVIIHGDHGSRVVDELPLAGMDADARTQIMSYSTQFAIRIPGEPARTVPGRFALDELLADFAKRDFSAAPRPAETPAWVLPMDVDWIPRDPAKLPPPRPSN